MVLRYGGKPSLRSNRQVDKIHPLCFCRFVAVGYPMDDKECELHHLSSYDCDRCSCLNYRPNKVKLYPNHWPLCVCGHVAQEHN